MSSSNTIPAFHMGGSLTGYLVVFLVPLGKTCSPCRVVSRCPMYVWSTQRGHLSSCWCTWVHCMASSLKWWCARNMPKPDRQPPSLRLTRTSHPRVRATLAWHALCSCAFHEQRPCIMPQSPRRAARRATLVAAYRPRRGLRGTQHPRLGPAPTRRTAHVLDLSRRVLSLAGGGTK
jgi:hypothetical protein